MLHYLSTVKEDERGSRYWIERGTCLSHQTVYNMIGDLEDYGFIESKKARKSRAGLPIRHYKLSKDGVVALLLGVNLQRRVKQGSRPKRKEYYDVLALYDNFVHDVLSDRVDSIPPGTLLSVIIIGDREGQPHNSFWNRMLGADESFEEELEHSYEEHLDTYKLRQTTDADSFDRVISRSTVKKEGRNKGETKNESPRGNI